MKYDAPPSSVCALCLNPSPLKQSHIIPAFVFRWSRETSATGHIRLADAPNKRVQDGLKVPLLCGACEERLGRWEHRFSEQVFNPLFNAPGASIVYGEWLLKFCVSLSWRVLHYLDQVTGLSHFSDEQKVLAESALKNWASFILDREPHPGPFEQHLIPLDAIESHNFDEMPQNINRYLLRTVELDVACDKTFAFSFVKIGPFLLFGFIQPPKAKWRGTKIHVRKGNLGPREYFLSPGVAHYLMRRARQYEAFSKRISDRQLEKIDAAAMADIERFRSSGTFAAMRHDERLFGADAVIRQSNKPKEP